MQEPIPQPTTPPVATPPPPDPSLVGVDRFEPSSTTLQAYYGTRKRSDDAKFREGGFKLPGLFDTQDYVRDRGMFIFAMILELIGVAFLAQVLYKASNLSQWGTVAIAALFVLIDVLLAYHHTGVIRNRASQLENDKLRIFSSMRDGEFRNRTLKEYLQLDAMTLPQWRVWLSFLLGVLIFASAAVKAFIFYVHWLDIQAAQAELLATAAPEANYAFVLSGLVLLSYLVVAIIHYRYTGYYLHGFFQRRHEKKDRKQRNSDPKKEYCLAIKRVELLPTMEEFIREARDERNQHPEFNGLCPDNESQRNELRNAAKQYTAVETRNRRHRLERSDDGKYRITAIGLLRDDDLIELVTRQGNPTAKAAVTLYGHLLQLKIMESARPRDQETDLTHHDLQHRVDAP
jgi:hypothetical protein